LPVSPPFLLFAVEPLAAPGWPSGPARDHGISRVTAYWYLDEVITCWQSAPRTWPRRKVGDITRAAFVLTHFEHSYIT